MRKPLQCIPARPSGSCLSPGPYNRSSEELPTLFSLAVMFQKNPFVCVWAPYLIPPRISEPKNSFWMPVSPISINVTDSWLKLICGLTKGCCQPWLGFRCVILMNEKVKLLREETWLESKKTKDKKDIYEVVVVVLTRMLSKDALFVTSYRSSRAEEGEIEAFWEVMIKMDNHKSQMTFDKQESGTVSLVSHHCCE